MNENPVDSDLLSEVAGLNNVKEAQVQAVLKLISEGATVPFIARYRKEATGNLDEEQIKEIWTAWDYGEKLKARKEDVLRLIAEKGKLTAEIEKAVKDAKKLSEVEDIYRPYKEKKKTRATDAKKKGLEPLADYLLSFPSSGDVIEVAKQYVTEGDAEFAVKSVKDALQGAEDIIAESIADAVKYRQWLKSYLLRKGILSCEVKDEKLDVKATYEMYYDYTEKVGEVKPHRILAINRGEKEKILKVSIKEDTDFVLSFLTKKVITSPDSITAPYVSLALNDAYKRLLKPAIEREIRADLKEKAEAQAIGIFGKNLRKYLLTPPIKGKTVLGIDPAFRTGCKLAVVDATGKFLAKGVIYPHQKNKTENVPLPRIAAAKETLKEFILDYDCEIIAMGNGTASRETEMFVANTIQSMKDVLQAKNKHIEYVIVNEAGASVYSASPLAREEFPDFSVEERSAVSIARRLQDPLAELVKIDPKSIGVGQYQYDVNQKTLSNQLDYVVESAVNSVGVNVNSASVYLLQRVSGLNARSAKIIVKYRDEHGMFASREDLRIKGLGDKTLEQAIGFLRVFEGSEKLDMTSIHPESYPAAEKILMQLGCKKDEIGTDVIKEKIKACDEKELFKNLNIGEYTFKDILDALVAPLRDPRDDFPQPMLKQGIIELSQLSPGMELQGTVRNVVDFGAFVDCGVHEDGLVHVSKMSKKRITRPIDVVSVGDIVTVWVVGVDLKKNRLELTMIKPKEEAGSI